MWSVRSDDLSVFFFFLHLFIHSFIPFSPPSFLGFLGQ